MFEPIMANYTPDGDDWTVEVTAAGETRTATAPGLIAARDATDQLVEELVPDDAVRTVVHTLDGDAFEFTSAYLAARLGKREPPVPPAPRDGTAPETAADPTSGTAKQAATSSEAKSGEASSPEPGSAEPKPAPKPAPAPSTSDRP